VRSEADTKGSSIYCTVPATEKPKVSGGKNLWNSWLLSCMSRLCYEHDVCLSVRPSVWNVGRLWSHSATKTANWHITR